MRTHRSLLASAVAVAMALTMSPAASSDEPLTALVLKDPAGDTWRNILTDEEPDPAGARPVSDVLSATVVHRATRVDVEMQFVDLQPVEPQDYSVQLVTPGAATNVTVRANNDNWGGNHDLFREDEGEGAACDELSHTIDYETDTVTVTVPRRCLGRPEWVRALLWNDAYVEAHPGQEAWYGDNPHNEQAYVERPTRRLVHSDSPDAVTLVDPQGDVWTLPPNYEPAGSVPTVDFLRTVVRHDPQRLWVRMRFVDLERAGYQMFSVIVWSKRSFRAALLTASKRAPAGRLLLVNGQFGVVRCPGLKHDIDYASNDVVVSIPRTCLKDPRWVRVGVDSEFESRTTGTVTDNPHGSGAEFGMTPRLYRRTP